MDKKTNYHTTIKGYDRNIGRSEKRSPNKIVIILAFCVGVLLLLYIGMSIFFMNNFLYNTKINGVSFSAKDIEHVESYIKENIMNYTLSIDAIGDNQETISGEQIKLSFKRNGKIQKALKQQNAFLWPISLFKKNNLRVVVDVTYDEAVLSEQIKNLKCMETNAQKPAASASLSFDGNEYIIVPEVYGTAVDENILKKKIEEAIEMLKSELKLEDQCFIQPKYTAESKELLAARDEMNKYCKTNITYNMQPATEVVDKTLISSWLSCDENMKVGFNHEAVGSFIATLADKYDTLGKTRTITSPSGKTAEVSGGTYGWSINQEAETQALIASIQSGETLVKEPAYHQGAAAHAPQDWGSTYVEVDLNTQYMWYITDGQVAFECAVVTGLPVPDMQTPPGVFSILEKLRDTILVGEIDPETGEPIYRTPVAYWVRATWSGIGFHDATWQAAFGGSLYLTEGSHGCINMPLDEVAWFYDMISIGTPVIVHY